MFLTRNILTSQGLSRFLKTFVYKDKSKNVFISDVLITLRLMCINQNLNSASNQNSVYFLMDLKIHTCDSAIWNCSACGSSPVSTHPVRAATAKAQLRQ